MRIQQQAVALGVCPATVNNYRRALRDSGKRITLATLRAHRARQRIGKPADMNRQRKIRRLRDVKKMTWAAIGQEFDFSGERAFAIYHIQYRGNP